MDSKREITSKDYLTWKTIEHNHSKKGSNWFIAVAILALAIIATTIIFENYTLAAVTLFATLALLLQANREPEELKIAMDNKGIYVNENHYPYDTLESFWIEESFGHPRVLIKSSRLFMSLIIIPINPEVETEMVEFFLNYYLDQEKIGEPAFQIFLEYLGF